ncbi:MAG: DNA polymerase ligase N-terminal domain-containing protein [Isosphaeraceae bacterium]
MPRFVVLEHLWQAVHWDFMLERDGTLQTWAVDAPICSGIVLPARSLADHRLIYLDYEGTVSANRGTVRRWDQGTYQAVVWTPNQVRVILNGTQLVGEAELWRSETGEIDRGFAWSLRLGNLD